jgi:hypothetical protein
LYDRSGADWEQAMMQLTTSEEIRLRMDELAHEYIKTPKEDPRRGDIASEISALCLQRQILRKSHRACSARRVLNAAA